MSKTGNLARVVLATFLAGSMGLSAQESRITKDFKLRLAAAAETKDNLAQTGLGIGFNLGYETSSGRYGFELGYAYKTGDPFLAPVAAPTQAGLSPMDAAGDSRRNQLDGMTLRFSFSRPFTEELRWQVGLQLGGTRFKHQYVGDIASKDWNTTNATSWRDTYRGVPVEGGMKPSLYAGISKRLLDNASLEINVLLLNYTALDYRHVTGSGTYQPTAKGGRLCIDNAFPADRLDKTNRMVPHVEVGYVLHF